MSLSSIPRLRIAAINFLNPAPLMWDFEHEPEQAALAERYSIHSTMPAECAAQLRSGTADIGLIPIASYATTSGLAIIPGCAIASIDRVRSILLIVRANEGVRRVTTVASDTSSLTSIVYARILFRRCWKTEAKFLPHAPDLEAMLESCDAALLIGDPALLALKDQQAREQRTGEKLEYIDLAHEWWEHTGTPWVSAFWAVRRDALRAPGTEDHVTADFIQSRDHGLAHIGDLAAEWAARISLSEQEIQSYLTTNIHYVLDESCMGGMKLFFRYAAECGALPAVAEFNWMGVKTAI